MVLVVPLSLIFHGKNLSCVADRASFTAMFSPLDTLACVSAVIELHYLHQQTRDYIHQHISSSILLTGAGLLG